MINIICVLPPSVHLLDMAGPVHIFYEANQYGGEYNLIYTSIETDTDDIRTSSGLSLHRLQSFTTLPPAANNTILLPGADFPILQNYAYGRARSFYQWLTQQYASGARICSVCTGAWLLGEAGLLNGRSYTTHWNYTSVFRERFPKATLVNDRFFVSDQRIISSAGVSSGIDLALHLVEIDTSTHIATQVAREAVIYRRRGPADPQLSVFLAYRNHIDDRIHSAQNFIIENMQRQLRSEEIAQHVNMSPRNFSRRFKATLSITPGQYLERLRAEKAYQLLRKRSPLQEVTQLCGLRSEERLRQLIRKYYQTLPSHIMAE